MHVNRLPLLIFLLLLYPLALAAGMPQPASTADHSKFEALNGPFETGPEVTRACLECHTEAAAQVHQSIHWTWEFTHPETGQALGKRNIVNSFCGGIATNYPRCTSCHAGYGWEDGTFDFTAEDKIDCLVCHDTTGTYKKFPTAAGHPPYEDRPFMGKVFKAVDLTEVAQHVGKSSKQTCGACHFTGGGGEGVKHGDMDGSLLEAGAQLDVHMAADGLDYTCAICHTFTEHRVAGSRYAALAKDLRGIALPGRDWARGSCESCHGLTPHRRQVDNNLNDHAAKVACQTCHIPTYARGGRPTKVWWDWSTAGQLGPDGKPIVVRNDAGEIVYMSKKGTMQWVEDAVPEYFWFDGTVRYTLLGEGFDPHGGVDINRLEGSYDDPGSRIWPFKVMRGRQPYDLETNSLLVFQLFGKVRDAYWQSWDWGQALASGMREAKAIGQTNADYSGNYDFVETRMYWPINHMVAPAESALTCDECHSQNGRLDALKGFYLPGRDRNPWIERIGIVAIIATAIAVLLHGLLRLIVARRRDSAAERN